MVVYDSNNREPNVTKLKRASMILFYYHKRFFISLIGVVLLLALLVLLSFSASSLLAAPAYAAGFPIVGVLHSGARPEAMAVDTQSHILYIAHESPGLVVAFDGARGHVLWRVTLGDVATDVQVESVSHVVFVTSSSYSQNESDVFVLSGATGETLAKWKIGSGDNGIALDATRHRIYVSSVDSGIIDEFVTQGQWQDSPTAFQDMRQTTLHIGTHPQGLGVNTHLGRLYVADYAGHVLRVVDETTMHVLATIPVADTPLQPLRVDDKTGYVYIVCSTGQELDVVDGNKNVVIARIPVAPYPEGITIDTATGRIYIADEGNNERSDKDTGNTITVLDGKTFQLLGTLKVGAAPDGVASDAALHLVYVALEDSGAVAEVSDSVNLPLQINETLNQAIDARRAAELLRQASIVTALLMLATVAVATYATYTRSRKAQIVLQEQQHVTESPRTVPGDESSLSEQHSLHS